MKYLPDTNSLSKDLIKRNLNTDKLIILRDIINEQPTSFDSKLISSNFEIIDLSKKHLDTMMKILSLYGDDLDLIRLYTNEGTGDLALLSFIKAEQDYPDNLFQEEYTIITKDKALIRIAKIYNIETVIDLKNLIL